MPEDEYHNDTLWEGPTWLDDVKHCRECGMDKPQTDFRATRPGSSHLRSICRLCEAAIKREIQRSRRAAWIAANGPCAHCGTWADLEIDHIDPSAKTGKAGWLWLASAAKREAELAKCQVLCVPCHDRKHGGVLVHGTRNGYVYHKCRCAECRAANAAYERERRQRAA